MEILDFFQWKQLFVFCMACIGSFIGMSSGGGGAIFPILALLLAGAPLHVAVGTNRIASQGKFLLSIPMLIRAGLVRRDLFPLLLLLSITGSALGAWLAISVSEESFRWIIVLLLFFSLGVYIFKPSFGVIRSQPRRSGFLGYFVGNVYGGIFSSGSGIVKAMGLVYGAGMNYLEATSNMRLPSFIAALVSSCFFFYAGYYDLGYMVSIFLGASLGGYLGTKVAIQKGSVFIRYMGMGSLVFTIVYIIWFK